MKRLLMICLLLFSPLTIADYVIITACGEPITIVFNDGAGVQVAPITAFSDEELKKKVLKVIDTEEGSIIEAETQYPIVCPESA